ncbi:MAG TPA: hypothetical protein VNG32_02665 [Candidatus Dormibacteraeota bacterium]|nr:hypothetical protein [Candidatus Dormibacteraeota bacterium]
MLVHPSLLVNALIVGGEGFWVVSGATQLRRLAKTRNTRGLSALTLTLNGAGNIAWCTYFASNHLWYPFATNVLVIILNVALLGYTLSNRKQFVRGLVAIAVFGPLTSYALLRFPAESGWFGMAYNWVAATPQLARIVHRKKVSGLSERSLYWAMAAMLLTLAYGLLIHSRPLVAASIRGILYNFVIFIYYYRYRRHD